MTQPKGIRRPAKKKANADLVEYIHVQLAERLKSDFVDACVKSGVTPSEILRLKMRAFVDRSKIGGH